MCIRANFGLNDNGISDKIHVRQTRDWMRIPDLGAAASTLARVLGLFGL
jgi:hypothetical protein